MHAVTVKLEQVFDDIAQTRMAGLPICNPALQVQVVGLREWQETCVGVLITPWTISLVLMPGEKATLKTLGAEEKMTWEFPSGKYEFMGLNEAALGACQIRSLISPVIDVESQEDAVNIARQVMEALFVPAPAAPANDAESRKMSEAARQHGEPMRENEVSRRDFLRGNFLGT